MTAVKHRTPPGSPVPAQMLGDELGAGSLTRAQMRHAAAVVLDMVPEDGQRDVLQALLAPVRRPAEAAKLRAETAAVKDAERKKPGATPARDDPRYRYPVPLGDSTAARDYRYKVRTWGRANGRSDVHRNGSIAPGLLNAYVEATGHRYGAAS